MLRGRAQKKKLKNNKKTQHQLSKPTKQQVGKIKQNGLRSWRGLYTVTFGAQLSNQLLYQRSESEFQILTLMTSNKQRSVAF